MEEKNWRELLAVFIPLSRIKTRYIDLIAYASDASFYHLLPKAIVQPNSIQEIQQLFAFAKMHAIPITYRAGGTSLSGQSITDGILIDLSKYWRRVEPEQEGRLVKAQPGITGAMVNASLKKYKRKIGPDPSSINSAMIGGILANNSSGMCCGVSQNSYHTLHSIKFVLPDGQAFDTAVQEDYQRFEKTCTHASTHLILLKEQILQNKVLEENIRHKYKTKNTVGYGLNSFIDFSHPLDILAHLLIGSEGTLGFIAEAVLKTVPDFPYKATVLLYFKDIHSACSAIIPLKNSGAEALELMDRPALRSIENSPGIPAEIPTLPPSAAALLCEYQANTPEELSSLVNEGEKVFMNLTLLHQPSITRDPTVQTLLWKLRKGMFPSVGAVRKQGTSVILEDVAFPLEHLADAVVDIQKLFVLHQYDNGIIFGHAKDGNIHFVVSQSFNGSEEIKRYERFIQDVVSLVVNKYNGTLKAEHGTGRNMAPFVETEWGKDAYDIMKSVKHLLDPDNLLNPGVIINNDAHAHLKNLKAMPVVEQEVDKCIECGYCEHRCPSRDITLTPRQRIVVRREMERLTKLGKSSRLTELKKDYQYDGLDTCAVDGLCAGECPVHINTGDLVKRLRKENHSALQNKFALLAAKNFRLLQNIILLLLSAGKLLNSLLGKHFMMHLTHTLRKIVPGFPLWPKFLIGPGKIKNLENEDADVLYFPACITKMMGASSTDKLSVTATFVKLVHKAGLKVKLPSSLNGNCCGQAFSSKGFQSAAAATMNASIEQLWILSKEGKIPVVMDVTSCSHTLMTCKPYLNKENTAKLAAMTIVDSIQYAVESILPNLKISHPKKSIVLHPVCSLHKMNLEKTFRQLAEKCSLSVTVPVHAGCCGMAGDRGFYFPELTKAAACEEIKEVNQKDYDGYYSSAKSCEISLSGESEKNYESILYLMDEVSE